MKGSLKLNDEILILQTLVQNELVKEEDKNKRKSLNLINSKLNDFWIDFHLK